MKMTYEEFVSNVIHGPYSSRSWSRIRSCLPGRRDLDHGRGRLWSVNWVSLAFALKLRCPDGDGWFSFRKHDGEPTGARWCWPWQFQRMYYEARKARYPDMFS